jgi:hypothetical protein
MKSHKGRTLLKIIAAIALAAAAIVVFLPATQAASGTDVTLHQQTLR